jgi:hypothetical protein
MNTKDPSVSPELTRAIADFAFGSQQTFAHGSRPLAWLSPDELRIDLDDPLQRRFGDYELLAQIGQGGMGVVYRARQHSLERDVAVKLLAAGPWASDEFVARFRREARHAARMQHPNIVEIYDFGHRDGINYFSMRLVEGPSLAQRISAEGPMPEREAAKCVRVLADAMDYAHRLDVLHLDLKPANVLIGNGSEPLIADFGLARRVDAGGTGDSEEASGTPSYMAPEQALQQSHPLSASTDIYGLGAILYELLTARPPFRESNVQATLERVLSEPPVAPRALRPGLSADLEAICLRCLEKQPADRYPTARELADDLQRYLDGHAVSARPLSGLQRINRWTRREPSLALAVGAAVIGLALGIAATAVAWRQAHRAQADAEYLGLRTMLPAARNTSIYALSELIRGRLSEDARRSKAKKLSQSTNPRDWIAAGLVGNTLPDPEATALGNDQLRRAAQALPNDRLALIAAIKYCRPALKWMTGGGDLDTPYSCPDPDAPRRLSRLEPRNLFAWVALIDPPGLDQSQAGHLIWQYEHEPEARARLRALMGKAAQATYWDAGTGALAEMQAKAYGVAYFPLQMQKIYFDRDQAETESADEIKDSLWSTWRQAWMWTGGTRVWMITRLCNPKVMTADAALREDCTRVFHLLAGSKGEFAAMASGWLGVARLNRETPLADEMAKNWRQHVWLSEQDLWARDEDPLGSSRQYMRDFVALGEWEADLRQADRVGVSRQPPPGWQPRSYQPTTPFPF